MNKLKSFYSTVTTVTIGSEPIVQASRVWHEEGDKKKDAAEIF